MVAETMPRDVRSTAWIAVATVAGCVAKLTLGLALLRVGKGSTSMFATEDAVAEQDERAVLVADVADRPQLDMLAAPTTMAPIEGGSQEQGMSAAAGSASTTTTTAAEAKPDPGSGSRIGSPDKVSEKAVRVGFEQHPSGQAYDQQAQGGDWDVHWATHFESNSRISQDHSRAGSQSLRIG